MKHSRFIFLLSISFLLFLPFISQAKGHSIENDILYYTNQFRKAHGLPALERVNFVDNIALNHSTDMAKGRVGFGHRGFDTRTLLLKRKYGRNIATGENVAYGDITGKEVVDIWINSPPHRKNLLGNFNLMGIGVAKNNQGLLFFTQLFVRAATN